MTQPSSRDLELLSTYLDGKLSQADSTRLETRLKNEAQLQAVLTELSESRALLRQLQFRRAPRNFTLTPKMAGIKPPVPPAFPIFRLASALAALLFFFVYTANLAGPAVAVLRANVPIAYGRGGGGGGGAAESAAPAAAPLATEAPMAAAAPQAELTATPESGVMLVPAPTQAMEIATTQSGDRIAAPTEMAAVPDAQMKTIPAEPAQAEPVALAEPIQLPVPPVWQFGLLALVAICGGAAWFVRTRAEQDWFKAHAQTPRPMSAREAVFLTLAIVALVALGVSIYWLSTNTFYAPAPQMQYPSGPAGGGKGPLPGVGMKNVPPASGDKGPVSSGDKNTPASTDAQTFTLTPGMGYTFSAANNQGQIIAIDFLPDSVVGEVVINYIPGYTGDTPPNVLFFGDYAFTILPAPKSTELLTPITLSIDYGDEVVSAVNQEESRLMLYWWSGQEWVEVSATCENPIAYDRLPEINRLRVPVCKMGSFLLVAP